MLLAGSETGSLFRLASGDKPENTLFATVARTVVLLVSAAHHRDEPCGHQRAH